MRFRRIVWAVVTGVALAFGSGCAMTVPDLNSPEELFVKANDDFMKRLRWGDYNGAAKYFADTGGERLLEQLRPVEKDLHITDVRLDFAEYRAEDQTMKTRVVVEYYLLPSNTVKDLRSDLLWCYQQGGEKSPGNWRITSDFPPFPGPAKP